MLRSKVGRSILREVDNSRLFLWFVGGKVHEIICGDRLHLFTQEKRSQINQWTKSLITK